MRTVDIAKRAARGLKNAKVRTILTSLAIAVGAFTLTISLAAGEGARQYTDKLLNTNVDPQILAIAKNKQFFEGGFPGGSQPLEYSDDVSTLNTPAGATVAVLSQSDIDKIAANPDIAVVSPNYTINSKYIQSGNSKKYTLNVDQYNQGIVQNVVAGSLPALRQPLGTGEIVLPENYVSLLGYNSPADIIGKKVTIRVERANPPQFAVKDYEFTVVAVTAKSATALSTTASIQIGNDEAREMSEFSTFGTPTYQRYVIATASVKEGVDPQKVKEALISEGYGVQTAKDLQSLLFTIVNTLQGIVFGFGVVALIASVFGIINTQYISVLERTREIGLMKALGMRGRHVSRLFQFEAAWIGLLGGIIGSIVAVALGTAFNPKITELLELGEGNYILVFLPIPIIILVFALTLVAMIAGFFPARKAARLDPIEALRVE